MIWSAMITAIAIVISACRSSSPWFQRRNACWVTKPTRAIQGTTTTSGTSQSQVLTSELGIENPWPVIVCWIS